MHVDEDETQRQLRGSSLLVVGRTLAILINFVVQIATVRYLPKADYGIYAFALSVTTVVAVIIAFGTDKAISRFLPVYLQDRDFGRFWGMLALSFGTVVGIGTLAILLFLSMWGLDLPILTGDRRTQTVLVIMAGLALCEALDSVFLSVFAALANPTAIFVRRHLVGPLLKLGAAIAVVLASGSVYAFAAAQLIAGLLGLGLCVVILFRIIARQSDLREVFSTRLIFPVRQLYSYSATLLSGDLSYLLRAVLVPIVLGVLYASEEIAEYQAVTSLARLSEFVLMTFSILFLPSAAKLAAGNRSSELQELFEKTTTWITLLSFPVFAVTFLGSGYLPVLLFGDQYEASGPILAWLAVGFFTNASFGTNLRLLRATCPLRTLLVADAFIVGLVLALVFALVPTYGALGGAWAVCGTYVVQSVLYHALVLRSTQVNPFTAGCLGPYCVGIVLCVACGSIRQLLGLPPVLGLVAAIFTSLAVLSIFWRQLDLFRTFPEITRFPVVGRWMAAASIGNTNAP